MFERLSAPHGLLRYGVAPDQKKIKRIADRFDRIALENGFRFWGNVHVGRDITVEELQERYDAIVLAVGASVDRQMGIPGEGLSGCYSSMEFVGWYNGHPDFKQQSFDLNCERAVIVGNGNVALDVARMLARSEQELHSLDMPDYARELLSASKLKEIVIVGRRGPAQISFTAQELNMLKTLERASVFVGDSELVLNDESQFEMASHENRHRKRAYEVLQSFDGEKKDVGIRMTFLQSPVEVLGDHCVKGVCLCHNVMKGPADDQRAAPTEDVHDLSCGLVISCIGYAMDDTFGLPKFGDHIAHEEGRVQGTDRVYVTGWAKTGPQGLIGGTKADAMQTLPAILADLQMLKPRASLDREAVMQLLKQKGIQPVTSL